MDLRGKLRSVVNDDTVRISSILGVVGLLMAISAAGILSGVGLFVIAMINMASANVIYSSLILSFSALVFLLCYLWLTA